MNSAISNEVICNKCKNKLQHAADYKSVYLNMESIKPKYVEIQSKDNAIVELMKASENQELCRFCKKLTVNGCYTYLQEKKERIFIVDMVQKYFPEFHLKITEKLICCESCLSSLQSLLNFMMQFFNAEKKNENMDEIQSDGELNLDDTQDSTSKYDDTSNEVNILVKNEIEGEIESEYIMGIDNLELNIKNEELEIKSEQNDCERYESPSKPILTNMSEYGRPVEDNDPIYRCKMCTYETRHKEDIECHVVTHKRYRKRYKYYQHKIKSRLIHDDDMETLKTYPETAVYECEKCFYKEKRTRHLINRIPNLQSEMVAYKCRRCLHETIYDNNFADESSPINCKSKCQNNLLSTAQKYESRSLEKIQDTISSLQTHEDSSTKKMYKCEYCSYENKVRYALKKHKLIHQNPSKIKMYQCDECSFKTKRSASLKLHILRHQNPSQRKTYKCEICSHETKVRYGLKKHMLIHHSSSEVKMYQCDKCSFVTKYRSSLKQHVLTHRNPSQLKMYKCEVCPFETKRKDSIKPHMLTHQSPSEVRMFRCDKCTFTTKHKGSIRYHMIAHLSPSETRTYKCNRCSFESKLKGGLTSHMRSHQSPSEIKMYKCDSCPFESKYQISCDRHLLTHKNPSEIDMHECNLCAYKAKLKGNLTRHVLLMHKVHPQL